MMTIERLKELEKLKELVGGEMAEAVERAFSVLSDTEVVVASHVLSQCLSSPRREITIREVMGQLNVNHTVAYNTIRILAAAGLLERVRHGVYACAIMPIQ